MELPESSRERNSEDSLNLGWEILGGLHNGVASGWLSNPVVAKDSDSVPNEGEVLWVYSKYTKLIA